MKNSFEFINQIFGTLHSMIVDDQIWFVSSEIYSILGLNRSVVSRIDECDKRNEMFPVPNTNRKAVGINEAGLYQLIFVSRKPEAKEFKNWITHEVIPSIRKNGGYIMGQENLEDRDRKVLEAHIKLLRAKVEEAEAEVVLAKKQVFTAQAEVQHVNAGNEKLSGWLRDEENRNFGLAEEIRECRQKIKALEDAQHTLLTNMYDLQNAEKYVESLRELHKFESIREELKRESELAAETEARIPYVKKSEPDEDPLINDGRGNIMRRSEFIRLDRH